MEYIKVILIAVVLLLNACITEPEKVPVQFIIQIDSISKPSTALKLDTVTIKLFGLVGLNGCHSFSHFEDLRQPSQLDLKVWGQRSLATVCTGAVVYLYGKEYKFVATQRGIFSINIHQPDGSIIRDSIIIQ